MHIHIPSVVIGQNEGKLGLLGIKDNHVIFVLEMSKARQRWFGHTFEEVFGYFPTRPLVELVESDHVFFSVIIAGPLRNAHRFLHSIARKITRVIELVNDCAADEDLFQMEAQKGRW